MIQVIARFHDFRDSHGPHQRRVVSPITEARQLCHHFVEDKQKQRQKKEIRKGCTSVRVMDFLHLDVALHSLCLQNRHSPQAIWKEVTTLSPTCLASFRNRWIHRRKEGVSSAPHGKSNKTRRLTFKFLTAGPTRSTIPANSCPNKSPFWSATISP